MVFELDTQHGYDFITPACAWNECGKHLAELLSDDDTRSDMIDEWSITVDADTIRKLASPSSGLEYDLTLGRIINQAFYNAGDGRWSWAWNHRDGGIIAVCLATMTEHDKQSLLMEAIND